VLQTYQPNVEKSALTVIDEELLEPIHAIGRAQQPRLTGKIIGTVTAPDGYPLTSATVHLMDISQITLLTEQSDHNGCFFFSEIPPESMRFSYR
jgi:hypothetical protein